MALYLETWSEVECSVIVLYLSTTVSCFVIAAYIHQHGSKILHVSSFLT
jgi:hypothetical protein